MLYYILNKTLAIGVLSVVIIFQPEKMCIRDRNTIENESINPMKAVQMVTDTFVMIFESMEDAYMREREIGRANV